MSIKSDLRKDGIEILEKLDTLMVNSIASNISTKLCGTFPQFNLNREELFRKLCRLDMYRAKMPDGMAEAKYFYKNTTIYFNEHISFEDMEEFAIHECIHYLQEVKDKKGDLLRMGLCDYTNFKTYGLGLNEAAVQLMSSKIIAIPKDYVKYFGISFQTTSPSYYPLECCLANLLAYLVGEDVLFESTIKSNDNFKNAICNAMSPKVFASIQKAFDDILEAEEMIVKLNNKIFNTIEQNKKIDMFTQKIDALKEEIRLIFFRTQNLILSSYFDKTLGTLLTLEQVEFYRKKLYHIKDLLGTADGYTFFNHYYLEKMSQLEHIYNKIENGSVETALSIKTKKQNKFIRILLAIKKILLEKGDSAEDITLD